MRRARQPAGGLFDLRLGSRGAFAVVHLSAPLDERHVAALALHVMRGKAMTGRSQSLTWREIVRATRGGRDAHGAVPFDRKDVWREGYDEAMRQVRVAFQPPPALPTQCDGRCSDGRDICVLWHGERPSDAARSQS